MVADHQISAHVRESPPIQVKRRHLDEPRVL